MNIMHIIGIIYENKTNSDDAKNTDNSVHILSNKDNVALCNVPCEGDRS